MSQPINDNLISVLQAAQRLGVSPRRVQALLEAGELPGFKAGGHWLVDRLSVRRRGVASRLRGRPFSPFGSSFANFPKADEAPSVALEPVERGLVEAEQQRMCRMGALGSSRGG